MRTQVVLAYSGGLDTSIILTWLKDTYGCEVVTFTADLGQVGFRGPRRLGPAYKHHLLQGPQPSSSEQLLSAGVVVLGCRFWA